MTWNCQLEKRICGNRQRIPDLTLRGRLLSAGLQKEPDCQFLNLSGPLFKHPCAQTDPHLAFYDSTGKPPIAFLYIKPVSVSVYKEADTIISKNVLGVLNIGP